MIDLTFAEWPEDRPRPTPEEWAAAEARFKEENDRLREKLRVEGKPPYMGDCGYALSFDMATCSRECWWHYFFPEERLFDEEVRRILGLRKEVSDGLSREAPREEGCAS